MNQTQLDHDIEFINILNQEKDGAACSILRVGQIRIMFDCGCNERIDQNLLEFVRNEAQCVDYILLSHSTCMHVGALAYLYSKGIQKKIIATSPVAKLGAQTMHELYIQKKESPDLLQETEEIARHKEFELFSLVDVEESFESIELVSYQERKKLKIGETELILKALPSGNSIGGTAWSIEFNKLNIIYAIDLNDKDTPITLPLQFQLFKGANLMISNGYIQPLQNGTIVSKFFNYVNEEKLRNRLEDILVDLSSQVLIPITSKNRIIHMLVLLEQLFTKSQKLQSPIITLNQDEKPVIYLEHMSKDTLDVAKSHLSWLNFKGGFQDIDDNPFAFKHIKAINNMQDLKAEMDGRKPRVIVTSSASLDMGFSRKFLRDFVSKSTNMIIFTEQQQMSENCCAKKILKGEKSIHFSVFDRIGATQRMTAPTKHHRVSSFQKDDTLNIRMESSNSSNDGDQHHNNIEMQLEKHTNILNQTSNQIMKQDEAIEQLKLEGQYNKVFDTKSNYPLFSLDESRPKLTFYGLDDLGGIIAEQGLGDDAAAAVVINDQDLKLKIQQQEDERNKALDTAKKERAQIEAFNRFTELQKEYGQHFKYQHNTYDLQIWCQISYLPFEARFDKETFELFLRTTAPKELLMVGTNLSRIQKAREFLTSNQLPMTIHQAPTLNKSFNLAAKKSDIIQLQHSNCFRMTTQSGIKTLLLDDLLYKYLPLQKITAGASSGQLYQVARIKAAIKIQKSLDNRALDQLTFLQNTENFTGVSMQKSIQQSFLNNDSKPSLLFRENNDYSLRDLQKFLGQHNFQTILLDRCLNYDDKLYVYFEKTKGQKREQLRLKGNLCKEYFQIRRLIYQHFGRL